MKTKLLLGLVGLGALVAVTGCVGTVGGGNTAGVPFIRDTVMGHYQRPLDQVFEASKEVIKYNGTLVKESILHTETNTVKTVEGKVNQRNVWVRVEAVEPQLTAVSVQVRTKGGAADTDLMHELEKQIAVKLATR